jgi:16S rRNA (uracil1498-N3)-methyltransferase
VRPIAERRVTREWRRLLLDPARFDAGGDLTLEPAEAHYLRRVLRLRSGDRFAVVDGCGHLWSAVLDGADRARLEQPAGDPLLSEPPPRPPLELLVSPPRRDGDLLLRMVCELGIDAITLVQAQRRVAPPTNSVRARAILREACEQCERLWEPRLGIDRPLVEALTGTAPGDLALLATTRQADLPPLPMLLEQHPCAGAAAPGGVRLAIGPEGGWSAPEEEQALALGWRPVSLGERILRTSTAAVAAAALLVSWRASPRGRL